MTTMLNQPSIAIPATGRRIRAGSRSKLLTIAAPLVLAGMVLAGWMLLGRGVIISGGGADRMAVSSRTFNVVLKEKGELKAAKSTDVKCEVEGRSTIISLIPEGTAVQKGDLLVELASDDIEDRIRQEELKESNALTEFESAKTEVEIQRDKNASDIRKADLAIELARLALQKYEKGDWMQQLKDAEIAIEQAQMTLERRQQDYEASKELYANQYTTQTEHDEAEFNFRKAEWDLEKAKMARSVLEQYTYVAELKQKESDLHEATKEFERVKKNAEAEEIKKVRMFEGKDKELALIRDQLAKFRTQKEKCRIYAPTQGFVVYYSGGGGGRWMNNDNQIKEGAEVFERQVLMQLPDTNVMNAVVRVHEAKTDKLREGAPATVTVEGIPGRVFSGKVTKIAVLADSQSMWLNPDLKEYETEITLDAADVQLKPGVTAHAEILVETVTDKLAVPVQAVYAKGGQRYLFRDNGDGAEHIPVELGQIGAEWAEVVSGINSGDTVLLAFNEELKRRIPDAGGGDSSPGTGGPAAPSGMRRGPGGNRRGPGSPNHQQRAGGSVQGVPQAGLPKSTPVATTSSPGTERVINNEGGSPSSGDDKAAGPKRQEPKQEAPRPPTNGSTSSSGAASGTSP